MNRSYFLFGQPPRLRTIDLPAFKSPKSDFLRTRLRLKTQPRLSPSLPYNISIPSVMGFLHDQETNAPLMEMDPFPHIPQREPPPYAYTALSPTGSVPSSPTIPATKTILVPPPPPPSESTRSSQIPNTPLSEFPFRPLNSADPLTTCDAKFADIIMTHVILPRLRVGVLKWKDRETFEFIPQTKDDVRLLTSYVTDDRKSKGFVDRNMMRIWDLLHQSINSDSMLWRMWLLQNWQRRDIK